MNYQQVMEEVERDYRTGVFQANTYQGYTSEYFGLTMTDIDQALQFTVFHEGVHFGYMLALRRALAEQGEKIFR